MLEPLEDIVYRRQWLELVIGFHFAFCGECESLGHILARSHERTSNRNALRNDIEERDREVARWQTYQDTSPAPARHANALFERR